MVIIAIDTRMIGRYIDDLDSYINMTQEMQTYVEEMATRYTERNVKVCINTGDNLKTSSVFLTVTGTSAEMGDDGSVGRGNRCNGLITPNRPMSMNSQESEKTVFYLRQAM